MERHGFLFSAGWESLKKVGVLVLYSRGKRGVEFRPPGSNTFGSNEGEKGIWA